MDQNFINTIEKYYEPELCIPNKREPKSKKAHKDEFKCKHQFGVDSQPIFIDLIIKIMTCRAFANIMDRKLLTAEKILGNAEVLIDYVKMGKLEIVTYPAVREESKFYGIDIL